MSTSCRNGKIAVVIEGKLAAAASVPPGIVDGWGETWLALDPGHLAQCPQNPLLGDLEIEMTLRAHGMAEKMRAGARIRGSIAS